MIPDSTIAEIKNRIDIEEVISDFVSLKRKGQNLWACCPFHNEKTPSFSVSPAKGFYKCFGCGKGGDSIDFVMEAEKLNYLEAIRYLAKKYGIEIKEEELSEDELKEQSERESLYILSSILPRNILSKVLPYLQKVRVLASVTLRNVTLQKKSCKSLSLVIPLINGMAY